MKFSIFTEHGHRNLPDDFAENYDSSWVDPPYWELVDDDEVSDWFHWTIDEMVYAAEQGFDGLMTNEHHQTLFCLQPSPNMMAAIYAKLTERPGYDDTALIQLGATLPTNEPPNRVAEEYAMLDVISRGRLIAGMPVGSPMDGNVGYGIKPLEQRERYKEAMDFVLEAWQREEVYPFNGDYYQMPMVNIWPRPVQDPHPPIWIPGTSSESTMEMCVERDFCYCALSFQGYRIALPIVKRFWEIVDEMGADPNPYRLGFLQICCIAESDAKAEEEYKEHILDYFHNQQGLIHKYERIPGYLYYDDMMELFDPNGGIEPAMDVDESSMSYSELVDGGLVLAGGPETVADQLNEAIHEMRCGNLLLSMIIGSMPHQLSKKNINLFCNEVMPRLDDPWSDEWENHWWPKRLREGSPQETPVSE